MKKVLFVITLLFLPRIALAQPATFADLVSLIVSIINPIFMLIVGLILLAFLFGLARTTFSLGNEDSVKQGKQLMLWGIIALFLAVSFWGIVALISNTFLGT